MVQKTLTMSHFLAFCFVVVMGVWLITESRKANLSKLDALQEQVDVQLIIIKGANK